MFSFVIVTVDDKIQSIKRSELSAVVITVRGSDDFMHKAKVVRNLGELYNVF
jgi:hypothetical protein